MTDGAILQMAGIVLAGAVLAFGAMDWLDRRRTERWRRSAEKKGRNP